MLPEQEIHKATKKEDGSVRIIKEGEMISFDFTLNLKKKLSEQERQIELSECKKIKNLYAKDVDGTTYYLSGAAFRKYIQDTIDIINKK